MKYKILLFENYHITHTINYISRCAGFRIILYEKFHIFNGFNNMRNCYNCAKYCYK